MITAALPFILAPLGAAVAKRLRDDANAREMEKADDVYGFDSDGAEEDQD